MDERLERDDELSAKGKTAMLIVVAVLGALVMAVTAGFLIFRHIAEKHTMDKGGMINPDSFSCEYRSAGGMEPGGVRMVLERTGNDTAELLVERWGRADEEDISKTISVPVSAVEEILSLVRQAGANQWGTLPVSEIQVLDAPVVSVRIIMGEKTIFADSTMEFPKDGIGFIHSVGSILESYAQ